MNSPRLSHRYLFLLSLLVWAPLIVASSGCDEAVVGREDEQVSDTSTVALCQDLGREICGRACDCGDGTSCVVADGNSAAPSAQIYDDLAHCEDFYVTLACLNPPNATSYYQDCIGAITSCVERTIDGQPQQAADLPDSCQNPNGFGIVCGDAQCERLPIDSPSNEVCCVAIDGDTSTSSCQAPELSCDGPSLGLSIACDGPEDCGGTACCGNLSSGVACTGDASCPADIAQYCHTNDDCQDGSECMPAAIAGFALNICANSSN